jgi:uncharacterized membrane protein AbrB (regulator of aidB expression)
MENAWHALRWIGPAVLLVYLAVESVAVRRLDSGARKQPMGYLLVIVGLMTAQSFARDVFENRLAHVLVGLLIVVYALVRSAILISTLRRQAQRGSIRIRDHSDDPIQTL